MQVRPATLDFKGVGGMQRGLQPFCSSGPKGHRAALTRGHYLPALLGSPAPPCRPRSPSPTHGLRRHLPC